MRKTKKQLISCFLDFALRRNERADEQTNQIHGIVPLARVSRKYYKFQWTLISIAEFMIRKLECGGKKVHLTPATSLYLFI